MGLDQLSDVTPTRSNHVTSSSVMTFCTLQAITFISSGAVAHPLPLAMRLNQPSDVTPDRSNHSTSSSVKTFRTLTRHLRRHYVSFLGG
ncbi:hypothetical protein CDAR_298131 [Caerostris darwini]|uniref:Uncharacterized protein n=1 Tax=Caerostris darwini TaxID=1538125 RepID=A0AAV4PZ11_9ARAC|nr:hypothetical protein CDAR_298131 [Caerostris darwini]